MIDIKEIIQPENTLEESIISDPEFVAGALYGKPRPGHPEGEVINHIRDVLKNIDKFTTDYSDRMKLRQIAIIHDSFKYKVDRDKPKYGDNHHATIARKFASKYITDRNVLQIIELHDEAYNAWSIGNRKGDWIGAKKRADKLIQNLGRNYKLFLTFFRCDTLTGNKDEKPLTWFEELVEFTNY